MKYQHPSFTLPTSDGKVTQEQWDKIFYQPSPVEELLSAALTVLEFLPVYAESCAGYQRAERLKKAISKCQQLK